MTQSRVVVRLIMRRGEIIHPRPCGIGGHFAVQYNTHETSRYDSNERRINEGMESQAGVELSDWARQVVDWSPNDVSLSGGLGALNLTLNRKRLAEFLEQF